MNMQRSLDTTRKVKLTIADFMRLNDAGAFRNYSKTELIDGEIVAVNAQFVAHARCQTGMMRRIADAVDAHMPGYLTLVEVAVAILPRSMPEPDITVTNFQELGRVPVPVETIALIVEIADSTLRFDLGKRLSNYAAAGVAEYWVVDVQGRMVHQHWAPFGKDYTQRREIALGERLEAVTIAGLAIETAGI
jgi:Uma2 family endonuclease